MGYPVTLIKKPECHCIGLFSTSNLTTLVAISGNVPRDAFLSIAEVPLDRLDFFPFLC